MLHLIVYQLSLSALLSLFDKTSSLEPVNIRFSSNSFLRQSLHIFVLFRCMSYFCLTPIFFNFCTFWLAFKYWGFYLIVSFKEIVYFITFRISIIFWSAGWYSEIFTSLLTRKLLKICNEEFSPLNVQNDFKSDSTFLYLQFPYLF